MTKQMAGTPLDVPSGSVERSRGAGLAIGDLVQTEHGCGIIVGIDLPGHDCWRWVVRIDEPKPEHVRIVGAFARRALCYFPHEVAPAERSTSA